MIGRRTICTPEITKAVADNIVLGLSNKDACANAGISETAFYDWLRRGREELERVAQSPRRGIRKREKPFTEFAESIKKAVPRRKQILVGRIQQAARGGDEYKETFRKYKQNREGKPTLVEERVTVKTRSPEWQAAAWLLERLHYDEFGRRQRVDVYDWRSEVQAMLDSGSVTPEDVREALGDDLARDFFESAGLDFAGVGETKAKRESG